MKDIFYLVVIGVLGVAVVVYPARLQENAETRMVSAVWNELEGRMKAEHSLRQELDSKRRNREFVTQMEYRQELVGLFDAGLSRMRGNLTALKAEMETSLDERGDALDKKIIACAERMSLQERSIRENAMQQNALRSGHEDAVSRFAASIRELETLSAQRLKNIEDARFETKVKIESLTHEFEKMRQRTDALEKRFAAYENQNQASKRTN